SDSDRLRLAGGKVDGSVGGNVEGVLIRVPRGDVGNAAGSGVMIAHQGAAQVSSELEHVRSAAPGEIVQELPVGDIPPLGPVVVSGIEDVAETQSRKFERRRRQGS